MATQTKTRPLAQRETSNLTLEQRETINLIGSDKEVEGTPVYRTNGDECPSSEILRQEAS
jgi:hypothetical protein